MINKARYYDWEMLYGIYQIDFLHNWFSHEMHNIVEVRLIIATVQSLNVKHRKKANSRVDRCLILKVRDRRKEHMIQECICAALKFDIVCHYLSDTVRRKLPLFDYERFYHCQNLAMRHQVTIWFNLLMLVLTGFQSQIQCWKGPYHLGSQAYILIPLNCRWYQLVYEHILSKSTRNIIIHPSNLTLTDSPKSLGFAFAYIISAMCGGCKVLK